MAQIRIHTYTRYGDKPFSALLAKLENPQPLLEDLGRSLSEALVATVPPVSRTGTLKEGLKEVTLYQKRGRLGMAWAVGIGNPNILTDWGQEAPHGTIAEFVKWLRAENKRARSRYRGRKRYAAKRAAERAARPTRAAERLARRRAAEREFEREVRAMLEARYITTSYGVSLIHMRTRLTRMKLFGEHASYASLRRKALSIAKGYKLTAEREARFKETLNEIFMTRRVAAFKRARVPRPTRIPRPTR